MLPFMFLFTYMRFMLFVLAKFSRKKIKRFKIAVMTSFTLLLTTPLNMPMIISTDQYLHRLWNDIMKTTYAKNVKDSLETWVPFLAKWQTCGIKFCHKADGLSCSSILWNTSWWHVFIIARSLGVVCIFWQSYEFELNVEV